MILPPSVCSLAILCYLAASAAGSCLSYGHSCWGAHGKRSGVGVGIDDEDTRWFVSRLAPSSDLDSINFRNQKFQQMPSPSSSDWFLQQQELRRQGPVISDSPVIIPEDAEFPSQDSQEDREIIVMEQPPRLYKILNHAANEKLDYKSSLPLQK